MVIINQKYKGDGNYEFRVLAKECDKAKVLNFGHKDNKRRKNFRKRHGCDLVKILSKLTRRYWSCQYLW